MVVCAFVPLYFPDSVGMLFSSLCGITMKRTCPTQFLMFATHAPRTFNFL